MPLSTPWNCKLTPGPSLLRATRATTKRKSPPVALTPANFPAKPWNLALFPGSSSSVKSLTLRATSAASISNGPGPLPPPPAAPSDRHPFLKINIHPLYSLSFRARIDAESARPPAPAVRFCCFQPCTDAFAIRCFVGLYTEGCVMSDVWKRWEGQLADNKFPLHHFLAATNHSAVFLTQLSDRTPRQAAIKFISADDPAAGQQLTVWNQVAQLSHPNLLRLFHWGRCRLDGMNLLYVVMECAEENLAQILPQRALTPEETRDMLNPVVDVLVYLHAKFLVHSHLKPSNLLAIGDLLKLSSDTIFPIN